MSILLEKKYFENFVTEQEYLNLKKILNQTNNLKKIYPQNTGWIDYANKLSDEEIQNIINISEKIKKDSEYFVVIGIGGSYLGVKALENIFKKYFDDSKHTKLIFAGTNLSGKYIRDLVEFLKDKEWSLNIISKSGTTLEPALAFDILRSELQKKYKNYKERILITTDKSKGFLNKLNINNEYTKFIIPDDIGGRYSIITPVGLLPLAVANIDIKDFIVSTRSCKDNQELFNIASEYAIFRNLMYTKGYIIELLNFYEPSLFYLGEWWKQLFGESEGKNHKGIFPTTAQFTTDLHSLGQYIQQGRRILFETVLNINNNQEDYFIKKNDYYPYLENKTFNYVNKIAAEATVKAHFEGNVPNIVLNIDSLDIKNIAELIYFFEVSCSLSCILLGNNPFDQPGVEFYKKNMIDLFNKI